MNYKILTKEILRELGIRNKYKGYGYIISCIQYISENEYTYFPVTKFLYVDIAKQSNTSSICVERCIRTVIDKIWEEKNEEQYVLISKIFGKYSETHKPSNTLFLASLYDYLKINLQCNDMFQCKNITYICPKTGRECSYYNNIFSTIYDKLHYD